MNQYIKTDPGLDKKAIATFGNGCFWCTEAIFRMVDGVIEVNSGYSGGHTPNPDYESVCSGTTGHAECIQVIFDPGKLSYDRLLEIFWNTHDPTTLNRQGNDIGTQYRSVVFYHDDLQYQEALSMMKKLEASGIFKNPIVTTLEPFKQFYPAESYHQDYYRLNGRAPYCQYVIRPKVEKFRQNLL